MHWRYLGVLSCMLLTLAGESVAAPERHRATVGGGCFWCLEAVFEDLKGVASVTSGYAGGRSESPTYEQVCGGQTGHAEVIQIEFDPKVISYEQLMEIFFALHDPTTLNRQGNDVGTQYRSIVLYENEAQKKAAELGKKKAQTHYRDPIVTEIAPLSRFYPAEGYHQGYYKQNPKKPYCGFVVAPKVAKMKKTFGHLLK